MIDYIELEDIPYVDRWESLLHSEGDELFAGMERRRKIYRGILKVLQWVKEHEKIFAAAAKRERLRVVPQAKIDRDMSAMEAMQDEPADESSEVAES